MIIVNLLLLALGGIIIWLGLKIAEEIYQIALFSAGAIAFTWGFVSGPDEMQIALEAASLGGLLRWQLAQR